MAEEKQDRDANALSLLNLFRDCVECFGLMHVHKIWDRQQRILLAKLGIEQARLLIWGDILGVCDLGSSRDDRLDDSTHRGKVEATLRSIMERPVNIDRATKFQSYGLRPIKTSGNSEPTLDYTRMEAFRERYQLLETPRRPSVTANHWMIMDNVKFQTFVLHVRENVNSLINLMDVKPRVDQAMKYDIKAFGWHPVFDRARATSDRSRLRMIREVCAEEYPDYATAAGSALDYLDKEWKDNNQEALERGRSGSLLGSEIPFAASKLAKQAREAADDNGEPNHKPKRLSIFAQLRAKNWGKSRPEIQRAKSVATPEKPDLLGEDSLGPGSLNLVQTRSKSVSVLPSESKIKADDRVEETGGELAQVETTTSSTQDSLNPLVSLVSRRDQHSLVN